MPPGPGGPYAEPEFTSGLSWGAPQPSQGAYTPPGYPAASDPYSSPGYGSSSGVVPPPPARHARDESPAYQPPAYQPPAGQPPEYRQPEHQRPAYPQPERPVPLYTSVPPPPAYSPEQSHAHGPPEPSYPAVPEGAAARPRNGFAVTGLATSFVPFLGLAFSIAGLGKAKLLGGIGRGTAILGVILSLVFIPGWCVAGYSVFKAVDGGHPDPACTAAQSDYLTSSRVLDADAAAMGQTKYGTRQFTDSVKTYEADFQALIDKLQADGAKTGHGDVRVAIAAVIGDLQQLKALMADLASGDFADAVKVGDISTLDGRLLSDDERIQTVCSNAAGG